MHQTTILPSQDHTENQWKTNKSSETAGMADRDIAASAAGLSDHL